jgi:hypothetical protein
MLTLIQTTRVADLIKEWVEESNLVIALDQELLMEDTEALEVISSLKLKVKM